MPRKRQPASPFRYFNSSPEVIRLVVMMYVRFPLSLRNVEDLLFERGILIPPIVSPAVPPRTSRLRVTVTAAHSDEDVDEIVQAVLAAWHEVMAASVSDQTTLAGPPA